MTTLDALLAESYPGVPGAAGPWFTAPHARPAAEDWILWVGPAAVRVVSVPLRYGEFPEYLYVRGEGWRPARAGRAVHGDRPAGRGVPGAVMA